MRLWFVLYKNVQVILLWIFKSDTKVFPFISSKPLTRNYRAVICSNKSPPQKRQLIGIWKSCTPNKFPRRENGCYLCDYRQIARYTLIAVCLSPLRCFALDSPDPGKIFKIMTIYTALSMLYLFLLRISWKLIFVVETWS